MGEVELKWISLILLLIATALLATNLVLVIPAYSAYMRAYARTESYEPRAVVIGQPSRAAAQAEGGGERLTVTGVGKVSAKPEVAVLVLGVITRVELASEVQELNAECMNKVLEALREKGVEQIETVSYYLRPLRKYDRDKGEVLVGYECIHLVKVQLEELDRVGEVIDAAVAAGANQVVSISFALKPDTMERLKLEAIKAAVMDAEAKARTVAEAAGLVLGPPISITVSESWAKPMIPEVRVVGFSTPVMPPEELSVTATVTITYGVEQAQG
ncbi:MAG: hypothetical protein DRJ57_04640 [Thermoprotei archaeon]|nr:MAG: hypothetical protein DRJ57_04640 [Thermoprotei archaeon]